MRTTSRSNRTRAARRRTIMALWRTATATAVGFFLCSTLFLCDAAVPKYRPVVLMHGLLADKEAMSHAQGWIEADFPGIHVVNCEVGDGKFDSMFMDINIQVEKLADCIQADSTLKDGFNMIGHSQGGLLTRAYVERFNSPPAHNLISWAGPHDGVYGVPDLNALCPDSICPWLDDLMDDLLAGKAFERVFQEHVSFATYWKDPLNMTLYYDTNIFLADINNERKSKNQTYKQNLMKLNSYLLVYSTTDAIVVPRESPWFEFYKAGQDSTITQWNTTDQYNDDWIGLKTLHESGRLLLETIPCAHQDIPRMVCKKYYDLYTRPLLNNTL